MGARLKTRVGVMIREKPLCGLGWVGLLVMATAAGGLACGSPDSAVRGDGGGEDATLVDGNPGDTRVVGDVLPSDADGGIRPHEGGLPNGTPCCLPNDCNGGACVQGVCTVPTCTSDGQPCSSGSQCCSGACGAGATCTPLNTTCKTLGNSCAQGSECCSQLCSIGVCAPSSFCGQAGEICSSGADCCSILGCNDAGSTFGTCAPPPQMSSCGLPHGWVCAGEPTNDAGGQICGSACCSRYCAPYGPTGVLVCQSPTGCHQAGGACLSADDCCGASGVPDASTAAACYLQFPTAWGSCQYPSSSCSPNGTVCRLRGTSCNETGNCCSGDPTVMNTCKRDNVGVPRCTNVQCVGSGAACASSADCCNGFPCVPNPTALDAGPDAGISLLVCHDTTCVSVGSACTVDADCCPGSACHVTEGSTRGVCEAPCPDGGAADAGECSRFGQLCSSDADCCGGVPCTYANAPCSAGQADCRCVYPD